MNELRHITYLYLASAWIWSHWNAVEKKKKKPENITITGTQALMDALPCQPTRRLKDCVFAVLEQAGKVCTDAWQLIQR
jgi:hypothetical protein